jgi:hypothetical protein
MRDAILGSDFPRLDSLLALLLACLVRKPFRAPTVEHAESLSAAQRVWDAFRAYMADNGKLYKIAWAINMQCEAVVPSTRGPYHQRPLPQRRDAVLWLARKGAQDLFNMIADQHIERVVVVGGPELTRFYGIWDDVPMVPYQYFGEFPQLVEAVFVLPAMRSVGADFLGRCPKLRSVSFHGMSTLQSIGAWWLRGAASLSAIDFEGLDALEVVGHCWLEGCPALTAVSFENLPALRQVGGVEWLPRPTILLPRQWIDCWDQVTQWLAVISGRHFCRNLKEVTLPGFGRWVCHRIDPWRDPIWVVEKPEDD